MERALKKVLGFFLFIAWFASFVHAKAKHYAAHEEIPVIVNKIGPFNNPTETYHYYSLPFCRSSGKAKNKKLALGEILVGDRKVVSPYEITFLDNVPWRLLCEKELSTSELRAFADAIDNQFYFEMFVDDLPMWGYLGEEEGEELLLGHLEGSRRYLYPHLHFSIGYNADQVVSVNVSTNPQRKVDITDAADGTEVTFSYSVDWVNEPHLNHANRITRYVDNRFLPSSFEIHWLSIINSFVLVLLLTAFLTIILMRVLKNDFTRYMDVDEEDMGGEEESGWKLLHGDVFRTPGQVNLFTALVGSGAQLACLTGLLLACSLLGVFRATKRGSILTAAIILYILTSFVGGYISARLYKQLDGKSWAWNIMLSALVFPAPLLGVFSWVNSVAWSSASTAALPWHTILAIMSMWLLISFPLTVLGGIVGRNSASIMEVPCRTNKVAREIPSDIPWYRQSYTQMFMAGFLPFSAIYIELHYIFASVWGHKIYTLFGILFLAFIMLLIVTSFITVALVYFQLALEDHRWWWRSFFSGGAGGLFIYAYSFFYYFHRSEMEGMLQGSFYFGYMAIVSYAFFIMLGTIGFYSSLFFVHHIYSVVKVN
mmetsp:Transcript_41052/g.52920  ORF Transcript_41052/g.52920 Transcript_41052/m.52920 type:complete len:598 (+) Transcript_41052:145-1938(+)|eukprot:CAMPEP_0117755708 /NCGR_PEP_ID=MMETSP0947-20121206/13613_1 /TAXON_ID=44440 /ORGANISM="Chattonella subsalsa, Strain CCMP2191" /LENGTH=597 /DNA_ID=CAMNT_0005575095 /DNA_START=146 /DNA_END=1939 /DNA_ORIENTATION=+